MRDHNNMSLALFSLTFTLSFSLLLIPPQTSVSLSLSLSLCLQIKAIGQAELNTSNPEEVLQLAAQKRKKRFLQAMAKLYF